MSTFDVEVSAAKKQNIIQETQIDLSNMMLWDVGLYVMYKLYNSGDSDWSQQHDVVRLYVTYKLYNSGDSDWSQQHDVVGRRSVCNVQAV
jgi:hypothetical protein